MSWYPAPAGTDILVSTIQVPNISGTTYCTNERERMEKSINGIRIGLFGVGLLSVSYARLFGFKLLSPAWSIAIVTISALAVITFVMAARLSSKWWYCGTLFSILSGCLVFAFAWG
jgi:hypothetical protein